MRLKKYVAIQVDHLKKMDVSTVDVVHGLHELRLSLKRLRSLCRLVQTLAPKRTSLLLIKLKSIARALSASRDRQVVNDWLLAHPELAVGAAPAPRQSNARRQLIAARAALLGLEPELRRLTELCRKEANSEYLRHGLEHGLERARRQWRRAKIEKSSASLHLFRRRLKDLQYQMEIFGAKTEVQRLARVTSALGEAHDVGLVEILMKSQHPHSRELARVQKERVMLEERALRIAEKLHLARDLRLKPPTKGRGKISHS